MKILIKNGIIVTMNDMRSIIMDGAIYIESNKIIEIGETSNLIKKYAADSDRIINAKNK
ncbi:MAG: amidohydrolase, partial [Tissierellales bacterium]|nr:amidohydrolase [Tissierellales bacterium]